MNGDFIGPPPPPAWAETTETGQAGGILPSIIGAVPGILGVFFGKGDGGTVPVTHTAQPQSPPPQTNLLMVGGIVFLGIIMTVILIMAFKK